MSTTKSSRICCVPGCLSSEKRNPELIFYAFPGRSYNVDRKKKWITAVRRKSLDKIPWVPTSSTRICSLHFVGEKKSEDPRQESYNPTIFPWKKQNPLAVLRAERLRKRREKLEEQTSQFQEDPQLIETDETCRVVNLSSPKSVDIFHEIGIQTDYDPDMIDKDPKTLLYCCQDLQSNEASTQTHIVVHSPFKNMLRQEATSKVCRSVAVNTVTEWQPGFRGFADIEDDTTMKQLTGVTISFFSILCNCISLEKNNIPKFSRKLNAQSRLLLFLMKMKLGLNFSAISCIFKVSRTTATKVFYTTLEVVFKNTKSWIFWPSRAAIKETMPKCFKNYPNCRAIIDCTELYCDTPPTVEQRALMYSTYKSGFTVKFLLAIAPSGYISFISGGFGGQTSDEIIVNSSGFLKLIEPGDEIMADKDFPQIKSELLKCRSTLIIPPFAHNPQFTREEVLEGYSIAQVRIHLERAIQRVKIFKILDRIPVELLPHIDKLMYVACVLANNKEPLIRKDIGSI